MSLGIQASRAALVRMLAQLAADNAAQQAAMRELRQPLHLERAALREKLRAGLPQSVYAEQLTALTKRMRQAAPRPLDLTTTLHARIAAQAGLELPHPLVSQLIEAVRDEARALRAASA